MPKITVHPQNLPLARPVNSERPGWQALVAEKVSGLNYGVVQIVVHDSHVVQVEVTERHRFDARSSS